MDIGEGCQQSLGWKEYIYDPTVASTLHTANGQWPRNFLVWGRRTIRPCQSTEMLEVANQSCNGLLEWPSAMSI